MYDLIDGWIEPGAKGESVLGVAALARYPPLGLYIGVLSFPFLRYLDVATRYRPP